MRWTFGNTAVLVGRLASTTLNPKLQTYGVS
jgi:hypothetical protein